MTRHIAANESSKLHSFEYAWLFLLVRMLGECSTFHSQSVCFFLFCFLKVEISSRTLIVHFRPGSVHSGSVSWDDCDRVFSDELRVSSFLGKFPHYAWTAVPTLCLDSGIVSPLWLHWVKGGCTFRCNLPPVLEFWAKWPGSFMCHCSNTGMEWTPDESQHTKMTGEENSPAAPAGIWTCNLWSTSPAL